MRVLAAALILASLHVQQGPPFVLVSDWESEYEYE